MNYITKRENQYKSTWRQYQIDGRKIWWVNYKGGLYILSRLNDVYTCNQHDNINTPWTSIWNLLIIKREKLMIWKGLHSILPIKKVPCKKHIINQRLCSKSEMEEETVEHALFFTISWEASGMLLIFALDLKLKPKWYRKLSLEENYCNLHWP